MERFVLRPGLYGNISYKNAVFRDPGWPHHRNIRVWELEAGSWVMFKLPGFAKAAAGAEENSLDALRNASKNSWFKADDALWVKVVSTGYKRGSNPGAADSVQISR